MSVRGEVLYLKMKAKREELVAKYAAGGSIRFDEAIGLIPVGGNPAVSTAGATVGALVANTGRREKRIPDVREGDVYTSPAFGTRVALDLDAIKTANLTLPGAVTGSMMEALKLRAEGKTILLEANDAALRWGPVILGEVKCMLKLTASHTGRIRNAIFPQFGPATQTGLIHSLPAFGGRPALVENEGLSHRGLAKRNNYRGDHEYLNNSISLWSAKDASGQSIMQLGVNSEIRMWGEDQVIDLNGFSIGAHERPNRVAAFSSIIDLSNGHFAGLTSKSAKGAHIFSSSATPGRLARNNHFAIRGHFVKGLLVENVISGKAGTLNQGSYFGSCILNDSSEIVFKSFKQEMVNQAVANSSMALSHYAQLFSIELGQGYYQRPSVWAQIAPAYPWMKWEDVPAGATDNMGLGKQTAFPVVKSVEELVAAGIPTEAEALRVRKALLAMQTAHKKSMKSADDTYIQVNTGHGIIGKTFPMINDEMTAANQIPRSINLIAQNPISDARGVRYPDSVAYGFRIGKSADGVGKLAEATITDGAPSDPFHTSPEKSISYGTTVKDVYILDCEFSAMHLSPMETIAFATSEQGKMNTFNGNGLRPYGYTNSNTAAASVAPASMLVSKEALLEAMSSKDVGPYESIDTAARAVANTSALGWTAKKAHGLYKGNDVVEAGLAAAEAFKLLKKYFSTGFAAQVLSGVDNSSLDLGVLAWRRSMMLALGAQTANHVGLKGGFKGDIIQGHLADGTLVDTYAHGEIYPWFVSEDGATSIDKDVILAQPAVAASATKDRTLSSPYLGVQLPAPSASLFRFKQLSDSSVQLVKCDEFDTAVTYQDCIDLLGFGSVPAGKTGSSPVIYDLLRNLDGQHHVHKGAFGVRLDSTEGFAIERLKVQDFDLTKVGTPLIGDLKLGSVTKQIAYGVNDDAETESGVTKARAVVISASTEGRIEEVYAKDLASATYVNGVEIRGGSSAIIVDKVLSEDLSGGKKAVGVKVAFDCQDVALKSIAGKDIAAEFPSQALVVEIEAQDTLLLK